MVANKHKYRVVEIFFLPRRFNEFLVTKIGISEGVHFGIRFKPIFTQRIQRRTYLVKFFQVFVGNSIWAVVICSLNNSKKGLLLLGKYRIGFQKQVLITYTPHINLRRLKIILFV